MAYEDRLDHAELLAKGTFRGTRPRTNPEAVQAIANAVIRFWTDLGHDPCGMAVPVARIIADGLVLFNIQEDVE